MRNRFFQLFLMIGLACFLASARAYAWNDNKTHPLLTEQAILNSEYASQAFFKENLGLENGIYEFLGDPSFGYGINTRTALEWVKIGAEREDAGYLVVIKSRFYNHFHNPIKPWNEAGLDDRLFETIQLTGKSSVLWAQNGPFQVAEGVKDGDWSWNKVRQNYYSALTAASHSARREYFAKTFKGLGYQMHLVQDSGVPAHVRNDAHLLERRYGVLTLEHWAKDEGNKDFIHSLASNPVAPSVDLNTPISTSEFAWDNSIPFVPISQFIDTNAFEDFTSTSYPGPTEPTAGLDVGLAEYTNANFFSDDTIFTENYDESHRHKFPFPNKDSTNVNDFIEETMQPMVVYGVNNLPYNFFYISKVDHGEQIVHFVRPRYHSRDLLSDPGNSDIFSRSFYKDERCHGDYAEKLIPRAVGYSRALFEYFFRGRAKVVKSMPFFDENKLSGVQIEVKNTTPQESYQSGHFTVVNHYRTFNDTNSAFENHYIQSENQTCDLLNSDGTMEFQVAFQPQVIEEGVGIEDFLSEPSFLVFKGTLGSEDGAVLSKGFQMGYKTFSEDWNNGLDGLQLDTWYHGQSDTETPGGGATHNVIVEKTDTEILQYVLLKENIRNAGESGDRSNQTVLDLRDPQEALYVNPYTYIQFKVDHISAAPAASNYLQGLQLWFSGGLGLRICHLGQCNNGTWNLPTITIETDLQEEYVANIFQIFQDIGIQITGPLRLESMNIVQAIWDGGDTSQTVSQRMLIDHLRLIDAGGS